jgi:hypothetical protein
MTENDGLYVARRWTYCYGKQIQLETLDESNEIEAQILIFVYEANLPVSTVFVESIIRN